MRNWQSIPRFPLVGPMEEPVAEKFLDRFLSEGYQAPAALIWLSSHGGHTSAAEAIASAIMAHPGEITIYNAGCAMSSAFNVYLAGDIRLASPRAVFMTHSVARDLGEATPTEMLQSAVFDGTYNRILDQLILDRTDITKEELASRTQGAAAWYFTAEQALKMGVCHEIYQGAKSTYAKTD